jgi:hypothetical protein
MSHFEQLLPVMKMISNMYHIRCKTEIKVIEHIECSCIFYFYDERMPEDDQDWSKHVE